eukprot:9787643-Heterocapsa_arctica.AAC.1
MGPQPQAEKGARVPPGHAAHHPAEEDLLTGRPPPANHHRIRWEAGQRSPTFHSSTPLRPGVRAQEGGGS